MKPYPIIIGASACLLAAGGVWWWVASTSPEPSPAKQPVAAESRQQLPDEADTAAAELGVQSQWLHPAIQTLIGQPATINGEETAAAEITFRDRREAVTTLPNNLSTIDHLALIEFINGDRPPDSNSSAWHAMVDSVINVLRRQEDVVSGFTQSLVRLYYSSPDPVLKDYALQYLRARFVDRDGFHQHETDPALCDLILDTLLHAAAQTSESYSGTALMGLDAIDSSSLVREEPATRAIIDARMGDFNAVIIKAATSQETDKHCRISALQVCAMRGLIEILPAARAVAADPKADPNIRISAIAAIGQLGTLEEDETLLKQLETQGIRLAHATGPALQNLASK